MVLKYPNGIDALKMMSERLDDPFLVGATKILIRCHTDRPAALNKTMQQFQAISTRGGRSASQSPDCLDFARKPK